ncbi:MAG: discoidin domain-containing protein [Thermoanaerobaculia bacterium]
MRAHALLAILLLASLPGRGDELRPRVVLSSETRESGGFTSSRLREYIELYFTHAFTETIELQLNLAGNHDDLASDRLDLSGIPIPDSRTWEVRPAGNLLARFGQVATETVWSVRNSEYESGEKTSSRSDERVFSRASWSPTRFAPGGSVRAWRSRIDEDASDREIVNDLYEASLDYAWLGLTLGAGQTYRIDRDSRAGYERTIADSVADLTYNETFGGGKFSVSAAAHGALSGISDKTTGDQVSVPTYVNPGRAFWGIDDTPLDSTDHPLSAFPTLVDGRASVLTTIDFGSGGASFQAIAFDIGRVSQVDEIEIAVRDEKVDPVTAPGGITWDVYTSVDGERWTPHDAELVVGFDAARSHYEISFERVEVRWIKVVNFGVAAQPAFATEAWVLFHNVRDSGGESEFSTFSSYAALMFSPVRSVTLGYTGSTYQTSQTSGESLESNVDDFTHVLSARYDPGRSLGFEARYEIHESETDRSFQNVHDITGSIRYMPRSQLSSTLTCSRREDVSNVATIDGRTCSLSATAQIFPTLDLIAGATDQERQLEGGGALVSRSYYASSTSRLTPSLRLTLSASRNRSTYENWSGSLPPLARDDRAGGELIWYRGRALELGAALARVESSAFSGVAQRYRVRWSPFGNGSVSLTTNYVHDIDPYTNAQSTRLLVSPQWQINRQTSLIVTYTSVSTAGDAHIDTDSLIASLVIGR